MPLTPEQNRDRHEHYLQRARGLELDSFACDWVIDCDTQKEAQDACVEAAVCHMRDIPEDIRFSVATALVAEWGYLVSLPEERSTEPRPSIDAALATAWPFPPVKEKNNG